MLRTASLTLIALLTCFQALAQTEPPKRALDTKEIAALDSTLRKYCDAHFPASVQELSKTSCYLGLALFKESSKDKANAECGKLTLPQSRPLLACRLGVHIADDISKKRDTFSMRMKLCQEHYPMFAETDAFLQEACWVGVTLAFESKEPVKTPRLTLCTNFSQERAFAGPCAVGLSLAAESHSPSLGISPSDQSKVCQQYFDLQQFHQGYRGCVNARGLSIDWNRKAASLAGACSKLTAGKNDEVETAACVIGGSIWHNLAKSPNGSNPRFMHCGDKKVSWTERDALACMTAAALLDLASPNEARGSCKQIFASGRRGKSSRRDECHRAVQNLAGRGVPTASTVSALPKLAPLKTDVDDPDLWPEAPDTPEEEAEANEAPATEESALNAIEEPRPNDKSSLVPSSVAARIPGSDDPQTESDADATRPGL